MLQLLRKDVVPALGCTEPVCVALCAAQAGAVLQGTPKSISVEVNLGIYKNAMSAGIPGCTMVGIPWAAAIGALLKNPGKQLQLLEDITPEILKSAEKLIADKQVSVCIKEDETSIYVRCTLRSDSEEVISITAEDFEDDFEDFDVSEDDILCTFEGEEDMEPMPAL